MDILSLGSTLLSSLQPIAQPTGMWESFIFGMENLIGNYGLTIILITMIIKIVMIPFDFFNRYVGKKNSSKMAIIQPELQKLQAKFGNNREALNQKTMELYKKHNYNIMGSCLVMLANMAITMTIFITLFNGLNGIASNKIYNEFVTLQTEYNTVYETETSAGKTSELAAETAEQAVVNKYDEIKTSFLWIENIWRPDTLTSPVLSYDDFINETKIDKADLTETEYNLIIEPIKQSSSAYNGYFVLIVLSAVITFLSTKVPGWVGSYRAKRKGTVYTDAMAQNKIMIYVLPAVMALFTLFYNSAFALYIVTNSLVTLLAAPGVTWLVESMYEKSNKKTEDKNKPSYSR